MPPERAPKKIYIINRQENVTQKDQEDRWLDV
jgi:hypothetical protein